MTDKDLLKNYLDLTGDPHREFILNLLRKRNIISSDQDSKIKFFNALRDGGYVPGKTKLSLPEDLQNFINDSIIEEVVKKIHVLQKNRLIAIQEGNEILTTQVLREYRDLMQWISNAPSIQDAVYERITILSQPIDSLENKIAAEEAA